MKIAEISIKRPVGTVLIVIAVIILGFISIPDIPVSFWPEFVAPTLIVVSPYPGVAPEEIEEQIAKPLEEALSTIDGVDEIETTCMEGVCRVNVRFDWGIDFDEAKLKVQEHSRRARARFPREAQEPQVLQVQDFLPPGIEFGFHSRTRSLNDIRDFVESKMKNRFLRLKNIAIVEITGGFVQQFVVEINPDKLYAYQLTLQQISSVLTSENIDLPAGKLTGSHNNYFVRTVGKFRGIEDIENLIIAAPKGSPVYLKDIAAVSFTNKERSTITRLNGEELIGMALREKSGGNTVAMCDEAKAELAFIRNEIPPDIQVDIIRDQSLFIKTSINNVVRNATIGAVLAGIIIFLFLGNLRNTLIIALSIPISIVATFVLIKQFGLSINTISLGGLALGVGMIVDSSVVVIENIFRHLQENHGSNRYENVVNATAEVGTAVSSSTLTSIVVFLPMAFLSGLVATLLGELALTIVFALSISVIVALTIVPMLSFKLMKTQKGTSVFSKITGGWQRSFDRLLSGYIPTLRLALRFRIVTILLAGALLVASFMLIAPRLNVEMLPAINQGEFIIDLSLPEGTRIVFTDQITGKIEADLKNYPEVAQSYAVVGIHSVKRELKSNSATITVNLKKQFQPVIHQFMEKIRQRWQKLPGATIAVRQTDVTEGMKKQPIDVRVAGDNQQTLNRLGKQIRDEIAKIPGVVNLNTSFQERLADFDIRVNREKAADLGVSGSQIAGTVRMALLGTAVTKLSSYGKEYDIKVMVDNNRIRSINDLLDLPLTTMKGRVIPVRAVAGVTLEQSPSQIKRFDQQRVVEIKGDVAGRSQRQVKAAIEKKMATLNLPPDYLITYGGQSRAIAASFKSLGTALIIAIFLVYVVMGSQFNSYIHPFTIAFTIPLALIGVLLGLLVFGASFSMNAFLGGIMLVGIVVNNGILLLDYINQLRAKGMEKTAAIIKGGATRLRPVLITSLTTVFGMLPIALGLGEGAESLQPLGAVVVGGLTTSTFLTLIVIPCVYSLFDRLRITK